MELNNSQHAAVNAQRDTVLTIAGAGSGKTFVAVQRITQLVKDAGVAPSEIMAITFTRKAAHELRTRIESSLQDIDISDMTIGTIHSMALGFLNRYAHEIGMRQDKITVYPPWAEAKLLKDTASTIGVYKSKWKIPKRQVDKAFLTFYTTGIRPAKTDPEYGLFEMFLQACRENNAMTYGMLLVSMMDIIPTLLKDLPLRHIIVDEVQDIDIIQWEIIEKLRMFGANVSLFMIGDYNQSIYSFRGAAPSEMFARVVGGETIRLDTNYRSVPEIVGASMAMINYTKLNNLLSQTAHRQSPGGVNIVYDCDTQAAFDLIDAHKRAPSVGVLARNHSFLIALSRMLTDANIAHGYTGMADKIKNTTQFQSIHAFLSLIVNSYDGFSFDIFANAAGCSEKQLLDIEVQAISIGVSKLSLWKKDNPEFDTLLPSMSLSDAIDFFDDNYADTPVFISDDMPTANARAYLIDTYGNISVVDYMSMTEQFDTQESDSHISLMTIHAAKGKQFHTVIVLGCNEGILPSYQSIKAGNVEEEQRLMYVAMTRAQDELILTVRPEHSVTRGREYHNPTSRFIEYVEQYIS